MKIYRDPKGLELKPCLNCVPICKKIQWGHGKLFRICPCDNHSGEKQRDNGKIIVFSCEHRRMHKGFPNALETHSKARGAKKKTKVSQSRGLKTR